MGEASWLTDEEQRTWRAFLTMRRDLDRAIERQLITAGLSPADFALLVPLSEAPAHRLRARDLGEVSGWERSRLSHHIRRMEHRGLVTRHGCRTDARGTYVQLTDDGMTAVHSAAPGHVQAVRQSLINLLSTREMETLRTLSERVSAHLAANNQLDHGDCPLHDPEPGQVLGHTDL